MLVPIAQKLDDFLVELAREAREEGFPQPKPVTIRIIGQMALLENPKLRLTLRATDDVDAIAPFEHSTKREFIRLLKGHHLQQGPVAHEAWMPEETEYETIFAGEYVKLRVADPAAVLISKAWKAPRKNAVLIQEFIGMGGSERFFHLADKYGVDLEQFV